MFAASVAGGAFLGMAASAVTHFAAVERKWLEVTTLMPDLNEKAIDRMKGDLDRFAKDAGVSLAETYTAAYQAVSAGVDPQQTPQFLAEAHQLALAGIGDLATAVDALTSAMNSYEYGTQEAGYVSDIFFKTIRGGKTTLQAMGPVIGQLLPIAAELNTEFEEISAAFQVLTAQGLPTAQAATQIRGLLSEFAKGPAGTLFESLTGETYAQYQASGGTLYGAVQRLRREAIESEKEFLTLFGSIEAGNAAAAISALEMAEDWQEAMTIVQGATEDAADKVDESVSRNLDRWNSWVEDVKISTADALFWIVDAWDKNLLELLGLSKQSSDEETKVLETKRKNWGNFFTTISGYARRFYLAYGGNLPIAEGGQYSQALPGPARLYGVGPVQQGPGSLGEWIAGISSDVGQRAGDDPGVLSRLLERTHQILLTRFQEATQWETYGAGAGGGGGNQDLRDNTDELRRLREVLEAEIEASKQLEVEPGAAPILPEFLQASELRYVSRQVQNKLVGGVVS